MNPYQLKTLCTEQLVDEVKPRLVRFSGNDQKRICDAMDMMIMLHRDQASRLDGPYINHPLRVAIRILDWGSQDADEVISALLHDVLEDQVHKLVYEIGKYEEGSIDARKLNDKGAEVLENKFGTNVRNYISLGLTTPNLAHVYSEEEWNRQYAEHIKKAVKNGYGRIKLSDFCDNCLGLDEVENENKRKQFCRKYYLVFEIFIEALRNGTIACGNQTKEILDIVKENFEYIKDELDAKKHVLYVRKFW